MKIRTSQLIAAFWLVTHVGVQAVDPAVVDGVVTVDVDRSTRTWTITVTNHSTQSLGYEMMGAVPRGLGLEVWDDADQSDGWRVHAEELADYLYVDGFPADIREIPPGGSEEFRLNPESMSATDDLALAKWERAKRVGVYQCRVFFGVYGSRLLSVSPRSTTRAQVGAGQPEVAPALPSDAGEASEEGELFGFQLRRMLDESHLALVDWHSRHGGPGKEGEVQIFLRTCAKNDLERMTSWDEDEPLDLPLHELVARAHAMARDEFEECRFEGLMINPCEDDQSKYFASIFFVNGRDDITVHLLMNGAPTKTTTITASEEQYKELSEYRIPKLRGHEGADQPATAPAPNSKGDEKMEPEP